MQHAITGTVEELEERLAIETAQVASPDLVPIVGANLRRLRTKRGLSLERLAKLAGVSRAMLSQIELAYSAPTINVVWRVARALGVPFGALLSSSATAGVHVLRADQAKLLSSHDGAFTSRALFPLAGSRRTEFYELRLRGPCLEHADAHAPGTTENLVVSRGNALIGVGSELHRLQEGDAIAFHADVPHSYQNLEARECVLFLVMSYASAIDGDEGGLPGGVMGRAG